MWAHSRGGGPGEGDALVYLHDTDDRQRIIAAAVSDLAEEKRPARCITGDRIVFTRGAKALEPLTPACRAQPGCPAPSMASHEVVC